MLWVQAFGVNNLNELTTATRSGGLTVAGTTTSQVTNVYEHTNLWFDPFMVFTETMKQKTPIIRTDVIGKRIRFILQRDLPYNKEQEFQERHVIIELESGLRFGLQQDDEIIDARTGV